MAGTSPIGANSRSSGTDAALVSWPEDPFDRMLIAQARAEGLTLVSVDRAFARYDVPAG